MKFWQRLVGRVTPCAPASGWHQTARTEWRALPPTVILIHALNVIYIDLGGKESFDLILKKHAKELPLSVQLGIGHVARDEKEKTALVRRQEKALKKSVRDSKLLRQQIDIMYDRPIRSLKNKAT